MGWLDLACYGSPFYETPHIDRLASQGMKFTNAYAACAVCSPTRAAVVTGQYPARLHLTDYLSGRPPQNMKLQVPDWTPYLKPETRRSIATEALKKANYWRYPGPHRQVALGRRKRTRRAAGSRTIAPRTFWFRRQFYRRRIWPTPRLFFPL